MTDAPEPQPRDFAPVWLSPADVKDWLRLRDGVDTDDHALVKAMCAVAEPYVERCRPEFFTTDPDSGVKTFAPDAEAYQGGVMYAAREFRRRNSPAGVEILGDGGATRITRWDTDIERALHTGDWAPPIIA